jgi:hypothetical protein
MDRDSTPPSRSCRRMLWLNHHGSGGQGAETAVRCPAAVAAEEMPACWCAAGAGGVDGAALLALEAAVDNPEGSFTSAAAEAARSRAAETAEGWPACWRATGSGVDEKVLEVPPLLDE